MPLPTAVLKQSERATEIHGQVYNPVGTENTDAAAPPPPAPAVDPDPQPEPIVEHAEGTPQDVPVVEQPNSLEKVNHQLSVLKGKYNTEIRRERDKNTELKEQVNTLQLALSGLTDQVNTLQSQPASHPSSGATVDGGKAIELVRAEMGDEIADGILGMVTSATAGLEGKIAQIEERGASEAEKSKDRERDAYYAVLDSQIPGWEDLNQTQAFVGWAGEVDPISGRTRKELLLHADSQNDADRVVAIFAAYNVYSATTNPAPYAPKPPPPAPGRGSGSAPAQEDNSDGWVTRREIAIHYNKVSGNQYHTDGVEKARIQKKIDHALVNHRVR